MVESWAKLLEAIAHLVGSLAWPCVALFLVIRFAPALHEFLGGIGEATLKGFGLEASAKRKAEAVAAIAAAQVDPNSKPNQETSDSEDDRTKREALTLESASKTISSSALRTTQGKTVLWVDDRHEENPNERRSLRALGFRIVRAESTDDAIAYIKSGNPIDLIISDLSRPEGSRAGFDMLKRLSAMSLSVPSIIYSSLNKSELRQEAKNLGAVGLTSDPARLIELIIKASDLKSATA